MMGGKQDGGQAFPSEFFETEHGDRVEAFAGYPGMSLRDWFAGQALIQVVGLIGIPEGEPDELWNAEIAAHSYGIADAMLAERSKP